ncbi:MAG: hypothetical protein C0392_08105 [Syntrophus sp. (in: bacteria)]|nr:hypothetical protein [Syntrophus sp. (in: bacteria)]
MERRDGSAHIPDETTLPGQEDSIPALVGFVSAHAWEGGFTDERTREIGCAVEEILHYIVHFACGSGSGEITIQCGFHDTGAIIIDIYDTGVSFNMLVAGVFPEASDFVGPGESISLTKIKKTIKNIEYRRDGKKNRNILTCIIPK